MTKKIGIAGLGAIGSVVAEALLSGINGFELSAVSEPNPSRKISVPNVNFKKLAQRCDMIIECLPSAIVPKLTLEVFAMGKDLIVISSSALLIYPEILEQQRFSNSRIIVPSGAIIGIDGVTALARSGIKSAKIASTKPPAGFTGAPYTIENKIDLSAIKTKTLLFKGNALEAAKAFPANVNVAATLSLAGIGPGKTTVEIWADPETKLNTHEFTVESEFSTISAKVKNIPDPANPKSSMLAAQSIISVLKSIHDPLVIL